MDTFSNQSQLVYEGVRFDVHRSELLDKEGSKHPFEAVVHPGATVILPLLNDDEIVMIRNQRFAIGKELWELPAGILEPNEAPAATAARELMEETGYQAGKLKHLLSFYTSPGMSTEIIHAYIARELEFVALNLEPSEWITVHKLSKAEVLRLLASGDIEDGKTALTLLYYFQFNC